MKEIEYKFLLKNLPKQIRDEDSIKIEMTQYYLDIKEVVFNTYEDHRVAMSLAALCPRFGTITVDKPLVVNKSYPAFWNEISSIK